MSYFHLDLRLALDKYINQLASAMPSDPQVYSYAIFKLMQLYLDNKEQINFYSLGEVTSILEGTKLEIYRRLHATHNEYLITQFGDNISPGVDQDYQSHLAVLKNIFQVFEIKTVLELGLGNFSTPFFLSQNIHLTSIESDFNWARKFIQSAKHDILIKDPVEFMSCEISDRPDLIFIDCDPGYQRPHCVNSAFGYTDLIITHDTEPSSESIYEYYKVNIPLGWCVWEYQPKDLPWTRVYSKNKEKLDSLASLF